MHVLLFPRLPLCVFAILFLSSTFSQEPSKLLFPFFLPFSLLFKLLLLGLYALPLKRSKGLNTKVFVTFGNDCPWRMWKATWKGNNLFLKPQRQTLPYIIFIDWFHAKLLCVLHCVRSDLHISIQFKHLLPGEALNPEAEAYLSIRNTCTDFHIPTLAYMRPLS